MRRIFQVLITYINIAIIVILFCGLFKSNFLTNNINYLGVYYLMSRIYILFESILVPSKISKHSTWTKKIYLLLVPVVGCSLYSSLYSKSHYKVNSKATNIGFDYDDIVYFDKGSEFFDDLYDQLSKAKKNIFIYFYIVKDDKLVSKFIDLIEKKHEQGIKINIKCDGFGTFSSYKTFYKRLSNKGININIVKKLSKFNFSSDYSYRSHKKYVVIDDSITYFGGMNLAQEYLGNSKKYGLWEDYMVKYNSKSLSNILQNDFNDIENKYSNNKYLDNKIIIESGFDDSTHIYDFILNKIKNAKSQITIVTPYVSMTDELFELLLVKQSQINIRFVVPGKHDGKFYASDVLKNYLTLLDKVEVYEIDNTFVHSKIFMFDDDILYGTTNFDMRSFFINDEIMVSTKDKIFKKSIEKLILKSTRVKYNKKSTIYRLVNDSI